MRGSGSKGFHVVEVFLVVAVLAAVGFVAWRVWDASRVQPALTPGQAVSNAVPAVNSVSDLEALDSFVGNFDTSAEQDELTKLSQDIESL